MESSSHPFHTVPFTHLPSLPSTSPPSTSPVDSPKSQTSRYRPSSPLFPDDPDQLELVVSDSDEYHSKQQPRKRASEELSSDHFRRLASSPDEFQASGGIGDGVKAGSNSGSDSASKRFTIRNTDTGEEIDLRDENKADYAQKFAKVLSEPTKAVQPYW